MKDVYDVVIPAGAKIGVDSISNSIGVITYYAPVPLLMARRVPTFDEFNELSNEVVWC